MTKPERWSDAGDSATETEQILVRSGQDLPMPSAQKQALWNQIIGALPPTVSLPNPASGAKVVSSSPFLATNAIKALCLVAALSGLTAGGYQVLIRTHSAVPAAHSPPIASIAVTPQTLEPTRELQLHAIQPETSTAAPVAPHVPASPRTSQLREESLALLAARQALRSNDATTALQLLERAQQRFRIGALAEERDALSIEALAKSGQKARAAARAKAFLTIYPRSPHAADVRRYLLQ